MTRTRESRRLTAFVLVPSLSVAALMAGLYFVAIPLAPVISEYYFSQQVVVYQIYRLPLLIHIAGGGVALTAGSFNLVTTLTGRRRPAHKTVGQIYVAAVLTSAVAGTVMAFQAYGGIHPWGQFVVTSGFLTLAVLWFGTAILALHAIAVRKDSEAHRFWMIVNFSLTFAAVTIRIENAMLLASGLFESLYPLLGWVSWVPNLLVGIALAKRQPIRTQLEPFKTRTSTPPHHSWI